MTIYDVKFYGAYFPTKRGVCAVRMSQAMFKVDKGLPDEVKFEAKILRKFEGKKDVLQLKFKDNTVKHETLYEPGYCYEDGSWKESTYREAPKAFLREYNRLVEEARANKQTNIFNLTFYCVIEKSGSSNPELRVSLSDKIQINALRARSIKFTAKVLEAFAGNKYVVRLEQYGMTDCEYIPLFKSDMRYDQDEKKWVKYKESEIPKKIIKCYIKYLNET